MRYKWIMLHCRKTTKCRGAEDRSVVLKMKHIKLSNRASHEDYSLSTYYQIISSLFRLNPPMFF